MSTIKLYSSANSEAGAWKLIPGKLFKIDNIADYLATFSPTTITDFQYVKNALEVSIKIDVGQINAQPNATLGYKYVSIQNGTDPIAYYYVKKPIWRSKSCVEFQLVMDVLNTYNDGSDYVFKANTRIIREHKDRFIYANKQIIATINYYIEASSGDIDENDNVELINERGDTVFTGTVTSIDQYQAVINITNPTSEDDYWELITPYLNERFDLQLVGTPSTFIAFTPSSEDNFSFETIKNYFRKIDNIQENINPLLQCGNGQGSLVKTITALDDDWYLLYRNQNDPSESLVNPVDCFLIPHNEKRCNSGTITDGRIRPDFIEENKIYVFAVVSGNPVTLSNGVTWSHEAGYYRRLIVTKAGGKLNCLLASASSGLAVVNGLYQYDDIDYASFSSLPVPYNIYNGNTRIDYDMIQEQDFAYSFTNTGTYNVIDDITALDRTDAKNIKLIKLPYCPYNFSVSANILQTKDDTTWEYYSLTQTGGGVIHVLRLKDLNSNLKCNIDIATINSPFYALKMSAFTPANTDLRQGETFESKLLNSEFYQPTYIYDSFSYKIQLEKCNVSLYLGNQSLRIVFTMTKTINSKFMFTFASYYLKNAESNYAQVMTIARNNEEVLYNVPYINYIRTGYNYDVKNKNTQMESNIIGVGLGMASVGASLLAPSVPLKVAGVVASLVSMAVSVKNAVVSASQAENSLQQKLAQTANQASSVAGSDDVDLMSAYAENRLKYLVYQPMDVMKGLLFDLFFYAGYKSERMGVPNHNTRVNFDYLECDAVLESAGANIPQEIIDEIKNCYKVGVTFIHKTTRTSNKWDIEQKYENWETSLLEG